MNSESVGGGHGATSDRAVNMTAVTQAMYGRQHKILTDQPLDDAGCGFASERCEAFMSNQKVERCDE